MSTLVSMVLICLHIKEIDLCNSDICITWNYSRNHLTLICTIEKMHLRVFFDDPNGNTQADCLPPYTNQCEAYYKNGSISINKTTKKVYFTMKGVIDHSLNGYWGCRHGMRRETAETYISIGDIKGNQNEQSRSTPKIGSTGRDAITSAYETQTLSMTKQTTSHDLTTATFLKNISTEMMQVSSTMDTKSTIDFMQDVTEENRELKDFFMMATKYGPLMGGIAIALLFVSCNFWISRRCRKETLKLPRINPTSLQEIQKNEHTLSIELHEIDSDNSDYEIINEDEMLPGPFVEASFERLSSSSRKQQTPKRTSKSDSQTSSERSYLDVIDDETYLNPYQSINVTVDSNDIHTYCIMTEKCKYGIPSRSMPSDFKNEMNQLCCLEQQESDLNYQSPISCMSVVDYTDNTRQCDNSDTVSVTSFYYKHSLENITLTCDNDLPYNANVLKKSNCMSTLL